MSEAADTERSNENLPYGSDYRFPADAEMMFAVCGTLELDPSELKDGRRRRRVNHIIDMIAVYHREARATGRTRGYKKRTAVAAKLWADVEDRESMQRKKRIMYRWEEIAERAGLLRVCDGRGARALEWELLNGWQRYADPSRGYSSAGGATSPAGCEGRRRPETLSERHDRRVRPYNRRVGNRSAKRPEQRTSVGRLLAPPVSHFSAGKCPPSGLGSSPTGTPPTGALHAHGGGAVHNLAHAPCAATAGGPEMPAPSTSAAAASEATEQRYERWGSEAEVRFEQAFGQPWHGPLRDREPLVKALRRLERSAQELAELNGWPAQEDRALGYLASLIDGTAEYRRHAGGRPPRHLGWFVPGVLAEARRCERKLRARRPEREARARRQAAAEARAYVEQVLRDRAMAEPGPPVEPGKRTLTGVPS